MKAELKNGVNWLATILFCISLAVVLTLLGSYLLFPLDAAIYQVRQYWPISAGALYHNFLQLMTYLQLPWIGQLQLTDFPVSQSGAQHFADVKQLFGLDHFIGIGAVCRALFASDKKTRSRISPVTSCSDWFFIAVDLSWSGVFKL